MSEIAKDTQDDLERSYESTLTNIIESARAFPEIWDLNPNLSIKLIHALVDQDETLKVYLRRNAEKYGFYIHDAFSKVGVENLLNPNEAARELRTSYKGIKFETEEWKKVSYEEIKRHLGAYLAEKEMKRRLGNNNN